MTADVRQHDFKLIGGNLSLDFVNTVGAWGGGAARRGARDYRDVVMGEKLSDFDALLAWGTRTGLVTDREARRVSRIAAQRPQAAADTLARAVKLREVVYRLFRAVANNWPPLTADVERLNEELAIARSHERLVHTKDGYRLEWVGRDEAFDGILWPLARSAADLLTSGDPSRIKQCGDDECGWLFYDTSRNRSRHWCDMAVCGNLAKVRRFRQRQRGG